MDWSSDVCSSDLPSSIRVRTVDKFQGQESPICLVSMTASSADETARGMEFLFSLNRINVAVSRAKALALVFGSDRLREANCSSVEQMRLVNTLCSPPPLSAPHNTGSLSIRFLHPPEIGQAPGRERGGK